MNEPRTTTTTTTSRASRPKIAVHSICRDEPSVFLERWRASAQDADLLCLTDTGSTSATVEYARDLGITVNVISVQPWRFDVARNSGLALLPADVDLVVKLDVDEVLMPGWRDALEAAYAQSQGKRFSYEYRWSHLPDGSPDLTFNADHTHSRFGWQWKHPCHEHLVWQGPDPEPPTVFVPGMVVGHFPDPTKSRGQYLGLLAQAVREDPSDDRMAHYYARELYFRGDWAASRSEFVRHLALPSATWPAERCESLRILGKIDDRPERWFLRAAAEDPTRREPWVDLMDLWLSRGEPEIAAGCARRALLVTGRTGVYLEEAAAYDDARLRAVAGIEEHSAV